MPCTGDGTTRKHPEVFHRWEVALALRQHPLQLQIAMRGCALLEVACSVLKSEREREGEGGRRERERERERGRGREGEREREREPCTPATEQVGGLLCYSTCSLNPIENEAVVAALLHKCGGGRRGWAGRADTRSAEMSRDEPSLGAVEVESGADAVAAELAGGCAPG